MKHVDLMVESEQVGYDFGVRDRLMVMADFTFVDLIKARNAVAYGEILSFGLLVNVPTLYIVFKNEENALQCFNIFRAWIQGSNQDADAVHVTFIQFNNGSHGIVIAPDTKRLLDRAVPSDVRNEYEPIIYAPNIMVKIPEQSEGFRWFKAAASGRLFLIVPATMTGDLLMDRAIRKREAVFYREDELPQEHPGTAYVRRGQSPSTAHRTPIPDAEDVTRRRARQLKRFFPVTLERLRFSETFRKSLAVLENQGFEHQHVQQAACNLTLKHRHPHLYTSVHKDSDASTPSILNFLLEQLETVGDMPIPEENLSPEALLNQVSTDSRYLLRHLVPDTPKNLAASAVRGELKRLGMIRT